MHTKKELIPSLIVIWLGHLLCDLMIGFWSIYKTLVGMDIALAGLILGCCATMGEGGQLLFGPLSDRGYRKPLLMLSLVLLCMSAFLPFAESMWLRFLLFAITCIGSGMFHPSASGLAGSLSHEKKGLYAGIFYSGGAIGMALSHMAFAYTYQFSYGKSAIFILPILCLVGFILFNRIPERSQESNKPKHNVFEIFSLFKRLDMRTLYFCLVFSQSLFWGTVFILPDLLADRHYDEWVCYGGGHMAFLLGGGFMMIPSGYLADRFSARSVLLVATIASIVLYNFFLFSPLMPTMMTLSLLFMMGMANGIVSPVGLGLGTRLVPEHPGMASAFLLGGVWAIAEFFGPFSAGYLSSYFEVNSFAKALGTLGVLNLAVVWLAWHLPTPEKTQEVAYRT